MLFIESKKWRSKVKKLLEHLLVPVYVLIILMALIFGIKGVVEWLALFSV